MVGSEIWKHIPGYEGRYEASSEGRIRRVEDANWQKRTWRDPLLKTRIDSGGYVRARIMRNKRHSYNVGVHQLVAAAFIGPCPAGYEVNHRDRNKTNNRPGNLEYLTHRENIKHARKLGGWTHHARRGEDAARSKLTNADVAEIRRLLSAGQLQRSIADRFGVSQPAIANIKNGKTWKHIQERMIQLPLFEVAA